MSRFVPALSALALCLVMSAMAPAAPVPTHLMPKTLPFNHPTAVGTAWVYKTPRGEITWRLTKREQIGDTQLITIQCSGMPGCDPTTRKMLLDDTGWFWVNFDGEKRDPPQCILKLPHEEGRIWRTTFSSDGSELSVRMQAVTVTPITPPGPPLAEIRARVGFQRQGAEFLFHETYRYQNWVGLVERTGLEGDWTLKSFTPGKE